MKLRINVGLILIAAKKAAKLSKVWQLFAYYKVWII
jgi:hypothetical protein